MKGTSVLSWGKWRSSYKIRQSFAIVYLYYFVAAWCVFFTFSVSWHISTNTWHKYLISTFFGSKWERHLSLLCPTPPQRHFTFSRWLCHRRPETWAELRGEGGHMIERLPWNFDCHLSVTNSNLMMTMMMNDVNSNDDYSMSTLINLTNKAPVIAVCVSVCECVCVCVCVTGPHSGSTHVPRL